MYFRDNRKNKPQIKPRLNFYRLNFAIELSQIIFFCLTIEITDLRAYKDGSKANENRVIQSTRMKYGLHFYMTYNGLSHGVMDLGVIWMGSLAEYAFQM